MPLDALLQDLRYAFRTLRASPGFAAVAILSLALGIGANTAIFSLIDAVMLKYLPVSHPEELVQITMGSSDAFTNPIWEQVRDRQDVFSGVAAYGGYRFNLAAGGEARYAPSTWASGDYFSMLGVRAILGRTFTPADDRRGCSLTAVLAYDFWQQEYGADPAVIGKNISLDGHSFQILGVTQPGFTGVDVGRGIDIFVPICTETAIDGENSSLDARSNWWLRVIGRPKRGLDPRQVTARLNTLAPQIFEATTPPKWKPDDQQAYRQRTFALTPSANGQSNVRTQYRLALLTLMAMVAVVLLIACANVANLLLARATVRQREIAIRMALGSGRGRLARQLLTESLSLAMAAAALGMLFAQWGSRLLVRFLSTGRDPMFLDLAIDGRVLAFTIAVAVATGLLFGIAPAWRGTRVDPNSAIRATARGVAEGSSRFTLGKALMVAQVALSLVLLIGAGLLIGTFRKLATLDPGFERDRVLLVNVDLRNAKYPPARREQAFQEMLDHLRAILGVRSASESRITPMSGRGLNTLIRVDGYVPKSRRDPLVWMNGVSSEFFRTMGTALVAGRDFDQHDTATSHPVAIVNESMTRKFFAGLNPVGKYFRYADDPNTATPVEIVGVVKDAKYRNLRDPFEATVYVPSGQTEIAGTNVVFELLTTGSPNDLIPSVKAEMEQVNRDITMQFSTFSGQVAESLTRERLLATLSGFFGGLALLLASIGLYGVMSYNMARRRNEIGIRMALGAAQGNVLRMVLGEIALLLAGGMIAGLLAALAATRLVATFLYGLTATAPAILALAALVLASVATLAGYLPARRASRLDPMAALREE